MVKRPDPNTVRRQPMARASGEIAWTQRDEKRPHNDIFVENMIDIDALNVWLDDAEIITEGEPKMMGSSNDCSVQLPSFCQSASQTGVYSMAPMARRRSCNGSIAMRAFNALSTNVFFARLPA